MELTPLPARSVVLSLMLGSHPMSWSPARLAAAGGRFGIAPSTLRAALTRARAAGDVVRDDDGYALGERLVQRWQHQVEAVEETGSDWAGDWETAVVVVAGRPGNERAALRDTLHAYRLAELREGVWMRPANLARPADYRNDPVLSTMRSRPDEDPAGLAARLWQLTEWSATGRRILATFDATRDPARRLAAAAAVVRQLASDPLLPAELLPADWPGAALRAAYAGYREELRALTAEVAVG